MYSVSVENNVARKSLVNNQADGNGGEPLSMVFVLVFCTVLLFPSGQQNRYNTATQLESIALSVREPLSSGYFERRYSRSGEAVLKPALNRRAWSAVPMWCCPTSSRHCVKSFIHERPVPVMVTRLFELPVQISLGVYSLERPANPQ
ncbi:hypothetical protein MJ524_27135 [Escherichia coli]|nr:hypothetical protein MJ524_27135 [Escherichia coli]